MMTGMRRYRRSAWSVVSVMLVMGGVLIGPRFGYSTTPPMPLWNDRAVLVAPGTVQAPNWVALAKELKPAVVNISTKRVEKDLPEFQGPSGQDDPFQQFFKKFFDHRPHTVRSLGSGFTAASCRPR